MHRVASKDFGKIQQHFDGFEWVRFPSPAPTSLREPSWRADRLRMSACARGRTTGAGNLDVLVDCRT